MDMADGTLHHPVPPFGAVSSHSLPPAVFCALTLLKQIAVPIACQILYPETALHSVFPPLSQPSLMPLCFRLQFLYISLWNNSLCLGPGYRTSPGQPSLPHLTFFWHPEPCSMIPHVPDLRGPNAGGFVIFVLAVFLTCL